MNKQMMIQTAVAVVIAGALAFVGGIKFQESRQPAFPGFAGRGGNAMMAQGQGGANRQGGNRMGFRPVTGDVIAVDVTTMTVKLPDGSTKIVLLGDATTVSKTDTGAKTDIKVGSKVGVFGTENKDGSVSAQNIQLNPQFRTAQGTSTPQATPSSK